jgi:ATP adenylyltransferase/5',5'''-P-1,P-4-tetraphosphate phosphorylase II
LKTWPLAATNYAALQTVQVKEFDFGNYTLKVQFNPARAVSSLASLDKKSIEARPCFLCTANRPHEQDTVDFNNSYDILVNPFPICDQHFTIASKKHEPQLIKGKLHDMLDLAKELPDYLILYNGPKSGASAPDHFHFQAGNADFFSYPLDKFQNGLIEKRVFISTEKLALENWFDQLYVELQTTDEEPLMNVFCQYKAEAWVLTIYPRKQHRPKQFFAEGKARLMVSPGAIDMTGILIVAREEDFEKITKEDIEDIFKQVS